VTRIAAILLALLALSDLGCTEPRSKRCSSVCAREAECHEKLDTQENFDEGECLDACAALERDSVEVTRVEAHADCVAKADSCSAVVACP